MAADPVSDQLSEIIKNYFRSSEDFDSLIQKIKDRKKIFEKDKLKQKILNLKFGEGNKKRIVSLDKIDLYPVIHILEEQITIYVKLNAIGRYIDEIYFDEIHNPKDDPKMYWGVDDEIYINWFKYLDFKEVIERFEDSYFDDFPDIDWKNNEDHKDPGYNACVSVEVYVYSPLIQIHEFDDRKLYLCYNYSDDGLNWFRIVQNGFNLETNEPLFHALKSSDDGEIVDVICDDNCLSFDIDKNGFKKFDELDVFDMKDNPQFLKNEESEPSAKIARKD